MKIRVKIRVLLDAFLILWNLLVKELAGIQNAIAVEAMATLVTDLVADGEIVRNQI
jgi:hypothetical protein